MARRSAPKVAQELLRYLDRSPSPYHAVAAAASRLRAAGFTEVPSEGFPAGFSAGPLSKHYYQQDGCLVAFAVGGRAAAGSHAFKVLAAHTDSPTLRVKPRSRRSPSYAPPALAWATQVSVETYGGGLWHTWFDRDLSLAGRVVVRYPDKNGSGKGFRFVRHLVHVSHSHRLHACVHPCTHASLHA